MQRLTLCDCSLVCASILAIVAPTLIALGSLCFNTSPQDGVYILRAPILEKSLKNFACPSLCEKVCYLVFGGNMKCFDCCKELLSNGMAVDLYMFGLFMKDRVCSNIQSCLTITIKRSKVQLIILFHLS